MTFKSTTLILATAIFGLTISVALAQTADQYNGPGGPRDKVEKFVNQYGLTLPASARRAAQEELAPSRP